MPKRFNSIVYSMMELHQVRKNKFSLFKLFQKDSKSLSSFLFTPFIQSNNFQFQTSQICNSINYRHASFSSFSPLVSLLLSSPFSSSFFRFSSIFLLPFSFFFSCFPLADSLFLIHSIADSNSFLTR